MNDAIKIIDIQDMVDDVKQQCTIAERYLFGFSKSWEYGYVSTDMIDEELNIVSDIVVNLNLDLENVKKSLNDYNSIKKRG